MKNAVLTMALVLAASFAQAAKVEMVLDSLVGIDQATRDRVVVVPQADGKLQLTVGGVTEVVEVSGVRDGRIADGNLVMELGGGRVLEVTAGMTGMVHYLFKQAGKPTVELRAQVYVMTKK